MIKKNPVHKSLAEPETKTLGQRLRLARKRRGLTIQDVADSLTVTVQAISQWERDTNRPDINKLPQIATLYRVEMDWLMGSMDQDAIDPERFKPTVIEVNGKEFASLPMFDIAVSAGQGAAVYDETPADFYLIPMQMLRTLTDAPLAYIAMFKVAGDSMTETVNDGDFVLVDLRKRRLTIEGIYTFSFNGDALVKRVSQHLETGTVTLISDNEKYPPMVISDPDVLSVVGRVFGSIRRH